MADALIDFDQERYVPRVVRVTLDSTHFTQTGTGNLVGPELPANAVLVGGYVSVDDAFDPGTGLTLDVYAAAGGIITSAIDLTNATGEQSAATGDGLNFDVSGVLDFQYVLEGTAPTTGSVTVQIDYIVVNRPDLIESPNRGYLDKPTRRKVA